MFIEANPRIGLDPEMQAEPDDQPRRPKKTIAAVKTQFINKEQEVRQSDHFIAKERLK